MGWLVTSGASWGMCAKKSIRLLILLAIIA
jgi:hypothetical protein